MVTVGTYDGAGVAEVEPVEPREAAVNEYVVDEEVDQPVHADADADTEQPRDLVNGAQHVAQRARHRENEKKQVVALEEALLLEVGLVMILVPAP